jgi:hypothetical protein
VRQFANEERGNVKIVCLDHARHHPPQCALPSRRPPSRPQGLCLLRDSVLAHVAECDHQVDVVEDSSCDRWVVPTRGTPRRRAIGRACHFSAPPNLATSVSPRISPPLSSLPPRIALSLSIAAAAAPRPRSVLRLLTPAWFLASESPTKAMDFPLMAPKNASALNRGISHPSSCTRHGVHLRHHDACLRRVGAMLGAAHSGKIGAVWCLGQRAAATLRPSAAAHPWLLPWPPRSEPRAR